MTNTGHTNQTYITYVPLSDVAAAARKEGLESLQVSRVCADCASRIDQRNHQPNRDFSIIAGDLRMTKWGRSRTIRETRLGFGETGTRAPGGRSSSHSWGL